MIAASEPCEGRCGCRLRRFDGIVQEAGENPYWPGAFNLAGVHTPDRCRALRLLREAAEDAAGPGGVADVRTLLRDLSSWGPEALLLLHVVTAAGVPACRVLDPYNVTGKHRGRAEEVANLMVSDLRDSLADGGCPEPCPPAVVIARSLP